MDYLNMLLDQFNIYKEEYFSALANENNLIALSASGSCIGIRDAAFFYVVFRFNDDFKLNQYIRDNFTLLED